jgi:acetyl esterase
MRQMTANMQEIIDTYAEFHTPPLEALSSANARNLPSLADAAQCVIGKHLTKRALPFPEAVGRIEHILFPTSQGELLARLYYPLSSGLRGGAGWGLPGEKDEMPLPVLLYFHGGGWVIGSLDTYDSSCRALCNAAQFIVMSVAYRQAPEHPFPAAVDDAFDAYRWASNNAESFGGEPDRVAVGGESAGANLAAVTCLRARDEGLRQPIHQLLIYPVTDFAFDTPSFMEFSDAKPLNESMMKWFRWHYLRNKWDQQSPYASPMRAASAAGLAPATIITAEIDPLCSDGDIYAMKLLEAGVPVASKRFDGVTHEFFGMKALLPEARYAIAFASLELAQALDRVRPDGFSVAV